MSLPRLATLVFVLLFSTAGSYLMFTGSAATVNTPTQLEVAFNSGLCMDNWMSNTTNNNKIDVYTCNNTQAQEWTFKSVSGGYLLVNGQGTCAADTGGGVSTSGGPGNYVYVASYACSSTDHNQIWKWNGQQIQNAYNNGCINDPESNTTGGQGLIVWPCGANQTNAEWNQVAPPVPSVSLTTPGPSTTVSGTITVSATSSVSPGSITQLTISAGGSTLGTCSASSCAVSWNTQSFGNGTYTLQATAVTSGGGSATAAEAVKVSNSTPSTSPPPIQGGGGSTGSGSSSGSGSGSGSGSSSGPGSGSKSGSSSGSGSSGTSTLPVVSAPSDETITPGSDTTGSGNDPELSVPQSPEDTGTGPTVYDIVSTNITSSSISFTWQTANADTYVVKYGTNASNLTGKVTVRSTSDQPSLTLSKLPAHTQIYVSITPSQGSTTGPGVSASFTTLNTSSRVPVLAIGWVVALLLIAAGVWFLRRRIGSLSGSRGTLPVIDIDHLQVHPRETPDAQEARVNWWLSDDQKQSLAQRQEKPVEPAEDVPDMFTEGLKRLEDEEKRRSSGQ